MEIGSIYEINPAWAEGEESGIPQDPCLGETAKYGKRYCSYTASGREATEQAGNTEEVSSACLYVRYGFLPFPACRVGNLFLSYQYRVGGIGRRIVQPYGTGQAGSAFCSSILRSGYMEADAAVAS